MFAPYLRYILEVDALFGAAVAAGLIGADRASKPKERYAACESLSGGAVWARSG